MSTSSPSFPSLAWRTIGSIRPLSNLCPWRSSVRDAGFFTRVHPFVSAFALT